MKYQSRAEEPSMFEILSGGLDIPVEHDYTKGYFNRGDKPVALKKIEEGSEFMTKLMDRIKGSKLAEKVKKDLIFRINKAESQYVSETHDNFRKYNYDAILKTFMYDIFGNPERNKGKDPIIEEEWMNTRYRIDYNGKKNTHRDRSIEGLEVDEGEANDKEDNQENNDSNKDTAASKNNKNKNSKKDSDTKNKDKKSLDNKKKEGSTKRKLNNRELTLKRSSEANRQKRIDEMTK